jgi:hypothetical protein
LVQLVILSSLGQTLLTRGGQIKNGLYNDLAQKLGQEALDADYDPTTTDSNLYLHWNSLLYPPIHQNRGKNQIGFCSNVFFNNTTQLCSLRPSDFTLVDGGRYRRINANPTSNVIFDFSTQRLNCKVINTSNIVTSNLTSSNSVSTNITTSNIVVTNDLSAVNVLVNNIDTTNSIKTGQFTLNSNGMFIDYGVPFSEYQILNRFGDYRGNIYLSQIVDINAIDLSRLTAGQFKLDEFTFGNDTIKSLFSSEWDF